MGKNYFTKLSRCCQMFLLRHMYNTLSVCIMLQFAKTKAKTRKNLILYYANFTNSVARSACVYSFNRCVYVDIQLSSTSANDVVIDRYKIFSCDYNGLLSSDTTQFSKMLNTLIFYAYEQKKYSPSFFELSNSSQK